MYRQTQYQISSFLWKVCSWLRMSLKAWGDPKRLCWSRQFHFIQLQILQTASKAERRVSLQRNTGKQHELKHTATIWEVQEKSSSTAETKVMDCSCGVLLSVWMLSDFHSASSPTKCLCLVYPWMCLSLTSVNGITLQRPLDQCFFFLKSFSAKVHFIKTLKIPRQITNRKCKNKIKKIKLARMNSFLSNIFNSNKIKIKKKYFIICHILNLLRVKPGLIWINTDILTE